MARQTYQPQKWENLPSETTPVSAERLTHIEQGVTSAMDDRALKEIYDDDKINLPATAMDASIGCGMIDITSQCSVESNEENVKIVVPMDAKYWGGFHVASGAFIGIINFRSRPSMFFVARMYETKDGTDKQEINGYAQLINTYSSVSQFGYKFDGNITMGSASTTAEHLVINARIDFVLNTADKVANYTIYKTYLPLPQQDLISKINSLEQRIEELENQLS